MNVQALIADLLKEYNAKYADLGDFKLYSPAEAQQWHDWIETKVTDDDIIIGYDYCTDKLYDKSEDRRLDDEFVSWCYYSAWPNINYTLISNGYHLVEDHDGSGGGLYYGVFIYRKIK